MSGSLVSRLRGSALVALALRGQTALPYAPRKRIEALRDRRVRETVRYAARWVPHYRDLFQRQGIDPRDIETATDLDRLPILDKEHVRAEPGRFIAKTPAARGGLDFLTSGTTAMPIEVRHDRDSLLANIAYGEREREPIIRGCGEGFRPKEVYVGYETSTFKKVIEFYDQSVLMPVRPRRRFVPLSEPLERVAAILNEERPTVLVGYGGWINLFFRTLAARGIEAHKPRMVLYMGEALPHGARELIEKDFGIPVMSRYNAVESFKIGFYCERRSGFHLHEDLCHVRIVDEQDHTVPAGQAGRILISNLINRGSVLLNYPIGDVGSMPERSCDCGRTLRLLSELEGRVEDVISLPDGRFVHPREIWQVFREDRDVLQYQLIEHPGRRFELRLATINDGRFARSVARASPELQRLLGPDAEIEPKRQTVLERDSGKFRAVVALR